MDKHIKKYILISTYTVVLYLALSNIKLVVNAFSYVMDVLSPMIIGIFIAFVLNIPLNFIENRLIGRVFSNVQWIDHHKRLVSILLTYTLTIFLIVALTLFVVPQVMESSKTLINTLPKYGESLQRYASEMYKDLGLSSEDLNGFIGNWKDIALSIGEFTANTVDKLFSFTVNLTSSVIDFVIGLVFSIYILFSKEKLMRISRKLIKVYIRKKASQRIFHIANVIHHTFTRFVGGQLTEAAILGLLCFVGMLILRIPYAPLISVLIAVTSLIPLLGAYIGTIPSAFIIFMENPMQALIFILFILIIQQIEGNLIYPKVVGSAIGLDGFWVFLAIIIGGNMFGILGMLLAVPSMAVIYSLVRETTNKKYKELSESEGK